VVTAPQIYVHTLSSGVTCRFGGSGTETKCATYAAIGAISLVDGGMSRAADASKHHSYTESPTATVCVRTVGDSRCGVIEFGRK
jgi:hypothetical protein